MLIAGNDVTISNVSISNTGDNGLEIFSDLNTVELANTTFSGSFGNYVISIDGTTNTLSGDGNVFNGTATNGLCFSGGAQNGSFTFISPVTTCAPKAPAQPSFLIAALSVGARSARSSP